MKSVCACLISLLVTCIVAPSASFAFAGDIPDTLVIAVADGPQLTYELSNERANSKEFSDLSPTEQQNFFAIRQKYLMTLAKAISKKSVARVASGVNWVRKKTGGSSVDTDNDEISLVDQWKSQQILGGEWPVSPISRSQKEMLQEVLMMFDNLLWDDCANISHYDSTGFLLIIQFQSGAIVPATKYGLFVGGGVAVDITNDDIAKKTQFSLNLYGEKNRPDPHFNVNGAYHLLNLKVSLGPQTKHRETSLNRVKSGKGWFLPGAPIHIMFEGDRLATLGNFGIDLGMLTLTASAGFGWLTQLASVNPIFESIVAGARAGWQSVLPVWLINKIATPLSILQTVGTVQNEWKTYRVMDFKINKKETAPKQEKQDAHRKDGLICLKLNEL